MPATSTHVQLPPTVDNVDRIDTSDPVVIERGYLATGTPVVLAGLWASGPVTELRTPAAAAERVGDVLLSVQRNYLDSIIADGDRAQPRATTLAAFVEQLTASPREEEVCIEYPTPGPLLDQIPLPAGWDLGQDPADAVSHTFLAGAGNYTHLHYDVDQRHVLLHQVFGTKRYVVIHPRETHKLDPMAEPGIQRCSGTLLHRMSDTDKLAFLRYANAWDCIVGPGETLAVPAMAWHYVEYVDTALSVSWRLPRTPARRVMADVLSNPSTAVQRVVAGLVEGDVDDESARELLDAVEAAGPDAIARATAAESACRRIWAGSYAHELRYSLRDVVRPQPVPAASDIGARSHARLHPGVEVANTVGATAAILVTAEGVLAARLERDWMGRTLEQLASRAGGIDVAGLAAAVGAGIEDVSMLVGALADRGWVVVD